ncbi:hypothetical protein BC827DRAFT_1179494 [Russula dissimulans]|nr:hypothetical protein BC827DRAFT_1179494 [Russula dissimulans]
MSQSPSPSLSGQLSPSDAEDDFTSQERIANTNSARQERLAALERRLNRSNTTEENPTSQGPLPFDDNHAKRTEFRRLVDPGITRPNSKEVALRSLRTLSKIADNLLREPDNVKFRQFKPTNVIIKRDLVGPKGALEYAVAMGFRPEVDRFQPYYTFNKKYMTELRIGAAILHEAIQIVGKEEDEGLKVRMAKAEEETRIKRAKEAFLDDRKAQVARTEQERRQRQVEREPAQSPTT